MPPLPIRIREADTPHLLHHVRTLFREYAESLDFNLSFQDFATELTGLPGEYAPPSGALLLAFVEDVAAACVGLRPFADGVCEMKRLYVRPAFRRKGVGRMLALAAIDAARDAGYRKMRLDTVPSMTVAVALYRSLGFVTIPPYRRNPVEGAVFLELDLTGR